MDSVSFDVPVPFGVRVTVVVLKLAVGPFETEGEMNTVRVTSPAKLLIL